MDALAARAEGGDGFLVGGARAGGGVSVWWEGRHGRGVGGASFFGDVGAGTRFYIGDSGTGVRLFSTVRVRVATSSPATGTATGTGHGSLIVGDIFVNYVGSSVGGCGRWRCGATFRLLCWRRGWGRGRGRLIRWRLIRW